MRKSFTRLSSILVLLFLSIQLVFAATSGPQLASTGGLNPTDGATVGVAQSEFTLTFTENVFPGNGGAIGLYTSAGAVQRVFQIGSTSASGTATFSGNKVTITFTGYTFTENSSYYVTVEGKAVKNATGELFAGIAAHDWDFTISDTKAPTLATSGTFDPVKGAKNVALNKVLTVKFSEAVKYATTGYSPVLGDFALYTSTNSDDAQEGGDLVSLGVPTIGGVGTNTWTITWPDLMPAYTDLYVRIKPGILADLSGNKFAGINDNTTWTFTTKDVDFIAPDIYADHASGSLWTSDNFYIDFDNAEVLSLVGGSAITASTDLKGIVSLTQDGASVELTSATLNLSSNTIKLDPKNNLTGTTFVVSIGQGVIKDAAGNKNAAASKTFTRGDWTAPTLTQLNTTNYSGTTFDILVKANEVCKVKYVVVKAGAEAATLEDVIGYTKTGTNITGTTRTHRVVATAGLNYGYSVKVGTTTTVYPIYAEGEITISNPSLEVLKRVTGLPGTNGQDYVVYAVAYDASTSGIYNPDYSAAPSGSVPVSGATMAPIAGNIAAVTSTPGSTIDIIMPTVWFDADSVGYAKLLNKDEEDGATAGTLGDMARKAKIYVHFNEGIRMADGSAIDEDDIPTFLHVAQGATEIGYSATYSADAKQITVVADSSFKSMATITVSIDNTEIEDLAGNELQPSNTSLMNQDFDVEEYTAVLALFEPVNGELNYKENCITVQFNDQIFVPRDDEATPGTMIQLSNDPVSPYWVGEYFDITEGNATAATSTDAPVKDEFDFTVLYTTTSTKVTICRATGSWSSETYYYVEAEGDLLDANRYTVTNGAGVTGVDRPAAPSPFNPITTASNNNQTISFRYGDVRAPQLTFFQPEDSSDPYYENLNGQTDVAAGDSIGVLIDEYVLLGFADEIDFVSPGGSYVAPVVGNAFRRYFKLESNGVAIDFDVKSVTVLGDSMILYLDPYYTKGAGYEETENFKAGVTYKVTYISTQLENNAGESYQDDNDNLLVDVVTATFTGATVVTTPVIAATYTPAHNASVATTTSAVVITFDRAASTASITTVPGISIEEMGTSTVTPLTGVWSNSYHTVTYDIAGLLNETETYEVTVGANAFGFEATTATWPVPVGADSVWSFSTFDGTAPSVTEFIPADNATGVSVNTDLTIVFDEDIVPVTGKKLWIWETGVTQVAQIDASNIDASKGDTIIISNTKFGALKYNKPYHVIIENGFVTDAAGNKYAGISDPAGWNFTTGADPAPAYAKFSITGETSPVTTTFTVTFSEPVKAVDNKYIRLFNVTSTPFAIGTEEAVWEVDEDITPINGTYNTSYTFTCDATDVVWTGEYTIQIEAGAFVDRDNNPIYACTPVVAGSTSQLGSVSPAVTAQWIFDFNDTTPPAVKFWPADNETHIPYNAYLYIQFDEAIALSSGAAIITDPATIAAHIKSFISLEYGAGPTAVDFEVEFVDNNKRTLRITPLDPAGYKYDPAAANNPTMQPETVYNLEIVGDNGSYELVDQYNNTIADSDVTFTTEDITAPSLSASLISDITTKSAKVTVTSNEDGKAYVYVVAGTPSSAPSAATVMANAQVKEMEVKATIAKTTGVIDMGDTEGAATYSVFVVLVDDETDPYADPSSSLWMFTTTTDEPNRIRDIIPAPNTSGTFSIGTFTTCDDDKPYIIATDPVNNQEWVGLNDSIFLAFNEGVDFGTINPNSITLRKVKNNAAVDITDITVMNGDSIVINPATLEEETWYYLEIDRYAVVDTAVCGANYFGEWVGKEYLKFQTLDNTAPSIDSIWPGGLTCIPTSLGHARVYFDETNDLKIFGGANDLISIYHSVTSSSQVLAEVIPMNSSVVSLGTDSKGKYFNIDLSGHIFLADDSVRIVIPANTIGDEFNNKYASNIEIRFRTIDNIPPQATWTLYEMQAYFNNSNSASDVGINSYWSQFESGVVGLGETSVASAPTHSILKIEFDEDIMIQTSAAGTQKWLTLGDYIPGTLATYTGSTTDGILSAGEIFNVLSVGDLKWNDDSVKSQLWIYEVTDNSITIGFDTLTAPLYVDADLTGTLMPTNEYYGSLLSEKSYAVKIAAGKISDPLECTTTRIVNNYTDIVTIDTRDDSAPELTVSACASNACVTKDGAINLYFDKPVVKSSYDIAWLSHESYSADNLPLTSSNLTETDGSTYFKLVNKVTGIKVPVTVEVVDLQNIVVTPAVPFSSDSVYTIEFNKWTVKEYIANNPGGTLFEGYSCDFRVADYMAPKALTLTPADNATAVTSTTSSISIVFDEKVQKGAGTLEIRRENGQIFAEIDVNDPKVSIGPATGAGMKKTLTIDFSGLQSGLEDFTMYYVVMPAGFVTDTVACAPNAFAGFTASLDPANGELVTAGWNFTTSDGTPPELITNPAGEMVGLWPVPGDANVTKNSDLVITLDEPITITPVSNKGIVIYYDNGLDNEVDFGNAVEFIPWNSSKITIENSDIYNNKLNDIIRINPTTVFDRLGTYYIRVNGDDVKDIAGNAWSSSTNVALDEVKDEEWKFTITNDVTPVLVSTSPAYDGVAAPAVYESLPAMDEGYVVADLSMTFEDGEGNALQVAKGDASRMVRIYEYVYNPATLKWNDRLWKEMPITDESIVINGNVVTIEDVVLRDGIKGDSVYYVTVDAGAITNGFPGSQTFWAGIANGFRWRFQTDADDVFVAGYDIESPNAVEDEVAGKNLTIDVASQLIVSFNEGIEALTAPTGTVQVWNMDAEPDTLVEAVTVTAAMCDGATLTVPLTKLFDETNFYVVVEAGAFGDTSTVSTPNFAFGGEDVWAFHTGDNTEPVPATVLPANGDDCVASDVTITVTYNETYGVAIETGVVTVLDAAGEEFAGVTIGEAMVDANNPNVVTIDVMGLPDTTEVFVTLATGFVKDGDQHSPLSSPEYTWSFTTGENTAPTVVAITPELAVSADTVLSITFSEVVAKVGVVTVNGEAVELTSEDGIVFTAALTGLESEMTYEVVIAEGAFVDVNAGCTPNDIAETTLTFAVADIAAPMATFYPNLPATVGDYIDLELTIAFDDAVAPATGNIVIFDKETDAAVDTISVTELTKVDDSTYSVVTNDLYYGDFYALIDAGSFVDATAADVAKEFAGVSDPATWVISIVDNEFDNCISIISPADGTPNVPTATDLVLEFCTERIVPGAASAFVTVAKQSASSQEAAVETAVVDSMISIVDGKYRLTIHAEGLEEMTTYSVIIAPGAVTDEAGNAFAGIIDANAWNFTTGDATEPVVSVVEATVNNYDGEAVITSNEAGTVYLVSSSVTPTVAAVEAAVSAGEAVSAAAAANAAITVSTAGLPAGTYVAVAVDATGNIGVSTETVIVVDVPTLTIAQIQGSAAASPYDGQIVQTKGIITTVDKNGYYIQDASAEWSGIYVYDSGNAAILSAGATVSIVGTVDEFNGLTELKDVTVKPEAAFVKITPIVISASEALAEKYESVRVTVTGTAPAASGSDDVTLNNGYVVSLYAYLPGTYNWEKDYRYKVTGIVYENNGAYKVEPYNESDIINDSRNTPVLETEINVNVYPNPFNDHISIRVETLGVELTKAVITNMTGQIVKEVINPENNIATGELRNGVYFISLHTEDGVVKTQRMIKR